MMILVEQDYTHDVQDTYRVAIAALERENHVNDSALRIPSCFTENPDARSKPENLSVMSVIKAYLGLIHHLVLMMAVVLAQPAAAHGEVYTVGMQDWLKIRHGDNLTSHPSLHSVMADWTSASPGSHIEIYFSEDPSHAKWAIELRNRLVALGIPSQHLKLQIEDMDDTLFGLRVVRSRAVRQ